MRASLFCHAQCHFLVTNENCKLEIIAREKIHARQITGPHRRILVFPFYIGCISRISRGISCISGYISHIAYSAPDIAYIAYIGPYIAYIGPYISYIARISGISQLYRIYRVYRRVYRMYIAYIDVNIAYIARISLSKLRLKLSLAQLWRYT